MVTGERGSMFSKLEPPLCSLFSHGGRASYSLGSVILCKWESLFFSLDFVEFSAGSASICFANNSKILLRSADLPCTHTLCTIRFWDRLSSEIALLHIHSFFFFLFLLPKRKILSNFHSVFSPHLTLPSTLLARLQYPLHRVFFTLSHRSSNGRKDFSSCIEVTSPSGVPHRFLAGSDHDDRDALTHTLEGYFIDFPEPATAHRVSYGASALCWKTPKPT